MTLPFRALRGAPAAVWPQGAARSRADVDVIADQSLARSLALLFDTYWDLAIRRVLGDYHRFYFEK